MDSQARYAMVEKVIGRTGNFIQITCKVLEEELPKSKSVS